MNQTLQSRQTPPDVAQHPLYPVLIAAIKQAMGGKGKRHGGATTPFLDQPWAHYAKLHGRGFLTGQAAKKLEEAASTRHGEAFELEVLGAIVYAGMALIHERAAMQKEKDQALAFTAHEIEAKRSHAAQAINQIKANMLRSAGLQFTHLTPSDWPSQPTRKTWHLLCIEGDGKRCTPERACGGCGPRHDELPACTQAVDQSNQPDHP